MNAAVSKVELRPAKRFRTFAGILLVIDVIVIIGVSLVSFDAGIVWLLITLIGGGPLFFRAFLTWIQVDDEGIRNRGINRKHFFIPWDEVDRIVRTGGMYWIYPYGGNFSMQIQLRVTGIPQFEILAKKHLPEEKWKKAFAE